MTGPICCQQRPVTVDHVALTLSSLTDCKSKRLAWRALRHAPRSRPCRGLFVAGAGGQRRSSVRLVSVIQVSIRSGDQP